MAALLLALCRPASIVMIIASAAAAAAAADDDCTTWPEGCEHGNCTRPPKALGYMCICDDGWEQSSYGEGPCDKQKPAPPPPPQPCGGGCQHGSCVPSGGGFECVCQPGWRATDMGGPCNHATGCDSGPDCGHGTCKADGGNYTCECPQHWVGEHCQISTNPCEGVDCGLYGKGGAGKGCHASDEFKEGFSYYCECERGWRSAVDGPCTTEGGNKCDVSCEGLQFSNATFSNVPPEFRGQPVCEAARCNPSASPFVNLLNFGCLSPNDPATGHRFPSCCNISTCPKSAPGCRGVDCGEHGRQCHPADDDREGFNHYCECKPGWRSAVADGPCIIKGGHQCDVSCEGLNFSNATGLIPENHANARGRPVCETHLCNPSVTPFANILDFGCFSASDPVHHVFPNCCNLSKCPALEPEPEPETEGGLIRTWASKITIIVTATMIGASGCGAGGYACSRRKQPDPPPVSLHVRRWLLGSYIAGSACVVAVLLIEESLLDKIQNTIAIEVWEVVCVLVTFGTLLCVPWIIDNYKQQLHKIKDNTAEVHLSTKQETMGFFGLCMFVHGVLDLVADTGMCYSLFKCHEWWLFACCAATLCVTTVVTLYLAKHTMDVITQDNRPSQNWFVENSKLVTCVALASASNLEGTAILRLRLCGKEISNMPVQDKFYGFLRNAGMYHYLLEDIPHILIALAQVSRSSRQVCAANMDLSASSEVITYVSLGLSVSSIAFGIVKKTVEMMMLDNMMDTNGRSTVSAMIEQIRDSFRGGTREAELAQPLDPGGSE